MKQNGTIILIVLNRIKAIAIQHEKARSWKVGDGRAFPLSTNPSLPSCHNPLLKNT
jgi:hypothetical protein